MYEVREDVLGRFAVTYTMNVLEYIHLVNERYSCRGAYTIISYSSNRDDWEGEQVFTLESTVWTRGGLEAILIPVGSSITRRMNRSEYEQYNAERRKDSGKRLLCSYGSIKYPKNTVMNANIELVWMIPTPHNPTPISNRFSHNGNATTQQSIRGNTYAIRCGNYVKIGFSMNLKRRIAELATSNPQELQLLGLSQLDEKKVHEDLASYRSRGEWFVLNAPVLGYIQKNFVPLESPNPYSRI